MSLAQEVYQLTNDFPETERFGLTSQIRRASVSIPTNIAEGHGRGSDADFVRFLFIALGSAREVETLLLLCESLGLVSQIETQIEQVHQISRMLTSLVRTLKTKD